MLVAGLGAALLAPLAALPASAATAGPAPDGAPAAVSRGVSYLAGVQEADGGFELADFDGFETSDAILAIASAAQTGVSWDYAQARTAVTSMTATSGADPLDNIDDLIDGAEDPSSVVAGAQAAKVVALVTAPLGESATDFDPSNDSDAPVDLLARIDAHRLPDGSYDFGAQFNGALYTAIALDSLAKPVPAALVNQIVAAQRSDGSWNFAGDQDADSPGEVDTTSVALLALRAAGRTRTDATVSKAVGFLRGQQVASGAWQAFGADDPNSTAVASVALSSLGLDLTSGDWASRATDVVGQRIDYKSPYTWLLAQQDSSGRFKSPNDSYGINTLATTQAVQALARQWYQRDERSKLIGALTSTLASAVAGPSGSQTLGANAAFRSDRDRSAYDIVMSVSGRERAAEELYQQAFGRSLDPSGRRYWSAQLATSTRPDVLAHLTGSAEFYRLAGSNTDGFVTAVYQSVLGRAPEAGGKDYWTGVIDAGGSVESVAKNLTVSHEYRGAQVDDAYQRMLGRNADAAGREFWTNRLLTSRVEVIMAGLGGSWEFYDVHTA